MRIFRNDEEIAKLVEGFERCELKREEWKHAEHLAVGLFYVRKFGLETAAEKMRSGILSLLERAFKVDLSAETPYHETLTLFWLRAIAEFNATAGENDTLFETANSLVKTLDKDYPLKFYSREVLFSDAARRQFVEADLVTAIAVE